MHFHIDLLFSRHILKQLSWFFFLFYKIVFIYFPKNEIIGTHACNLLAFIISAVGLKCTFLQWVCKNLYNQVVLQTAYWVSCIGHLLLDKTAVWKSLTKVMNSFNLSTGNFCKTILQSFSNGFLTWSWISVMVRNLFWFWMIEHISLQTRGCHEKK